MNSIINVKVPNTIELAYTLYANGMNLTKPILDIAGEFYTLSYPSDSVMVLFYTFREFRRCCVVTGWNEGLGLEPVCLPGVDGKLSLLYETRGRKLDDMKRILFLLTRENKYEIYRFSYLFWFHLIALIECSGGKKWEVKKLYRDYKRQNENEK